jgi:trk system potassium uptake protein
LKPSKLLFYLGLVLVVLGAFMATALPWTFLDSANPGSSMAWSLCVAVTLGCGLIAHLIGRRSGSGDNSSWRDLSDSSGTEITRREAMLIVCMAWLMCIFFSAMPLLADGMVGGVVDALFEATSGITTTGSTVLTDIESSSRASLWWRSMIGWLGGMGIIVLFIAILPQAGSGGRRLFESEAPGPTKDQLRPRIRETGLTLWKIYSGMTVVLFAVLALEGMGLFDAACHAMTTIATAGFSTRSESIGAFNSPLIEMTIALFMVLAGVNFGLYYAVRSRRDLGALRDRELGAYIAILLGATLVITLGLLERSQGDVLEALRYALFQVAATVSTTGYSSDDFNLYPNHCRMLFLLLMFVGAMGGSTGGGFKVSRLLIILSTSFQEIRHGLHPRAVFSTRLGSRLIESRVVATVTAMFVIAVVGLCLGTFALTAMGLEFETALSATITALFNGGPALNELGPAGNFSSVPAAGKLLLSGLMLVGRLEFYTVLALLLPEFWRHR